MSLVSKITFGLCCVTSVGVIGYVHWKQQYDRQQLHLGVIRDIERQERRKAQNLYLLQQQIGLTQHLKEEQAREELQQEEESKTSKIPSPATASETIAVH